ncbi:MAG: hypothetical protein WC222_05720 [Parachlamydiales bacterium]|jgi:hypothetical protein
MNNTTKIIALIGLVCVLTFTALPTVLGTKPGLKLVNYFASKSAHADVSITDASFSWFGPQVLERVILKDNSANGKITVDSIKVDDSLFSLMFGRKTTAILLTNGNIRWGLRAPIEVHDLNVNWNDAHKTLELSGDTVFQEQKGTIAVNIRDFDLGSLSSPEDLGKSNFNVNIQDLPVSLISYLYAISGHGTMPFEEMLGNSLNLSIAQTSAGHYAVKAFSSQLNAKAEINHHEQKLTLTQPLSILWKGLQATVYGNYDLATSKGVFETKELPLGFVELINPNAGKYLRGALSLLVNFDLSNSETAHISGLVTSDNFSDTPLNFKLDVPRDINTKSLLSFSAVANHPDFHFETNGKLSPLNKDSLVASMEGTAKMKNFPFEAYLSPDLSALMGSKNDVDLKFHYDSGYNQAGQINVAVNGENVSLTADLSLDEQMRLQQVGKKVELQANLPPALMRTLLSDTSLADLQWDRPVPVHLSIDRLMIPPSIWQGGSNVHFLDAILSRSVEGTISLGPLEAWLPSRESKLLIGVLEGSISTTEDGTGLHLALNSSGGDTNIQIDGNFGLVRSQPIQLNFQTTSVPTEFIALFAGNDRSLVNVLKGIVGNTMNINGAVNWQGDKGSIVASIASSNAQVQLDGYINQGVLFLNKPFQMQASITKHVVDNFFSKTLPIMDGVISAEGPILLSLDPEGFSCPLTNFEIAKVAIRSGVIKADRLNFSPESELGSMLAALTPIEETVVSVRSTPLYFKLENGTATIYRWDMLLMDKMPIACWGYIDLVKEKMSMVLGLTPRAVEVAFNVPGLSPDHMLQIPIKGKLGNVSVDKRGAAAQLSRLVAKSTRGPEGLILNTFMQLTSGFVKDMPAPPPTTTPLPWDTNSSRPAASPIFDGVDKGIVQPVETVIKKGTRGAGSLLNQIFR